jgi:hypothetical protein
MSKREKKEKECLEYLEREMNLIGVTAVEDLLQESVRDCIEHIREARVKGKEFNTQFGCSLETNWKLQNALGSALVSSHWIRPIWS